MWRSLFRQPYPRDERSRAYAVMNNVFLHIHPVRVRQHAVKFAYTFCLGGLSFFLFLVLTVTGVYLMFFYVPSATQAYTNILEIQSQVTFGLLTRNIHRWAAHLMVFFVFLHMMRVFYHGAYKPPREFNWVVGVVLLFLTIMLSFTGYLLPWDQIAYWAITIGTNFGSYFPIVNSPTKSILLGGLEVGQNTLLRFYVRPRHLPAADRGHLPCRPLLADPQGRRYLRAALTVDATIAIGRCERWSVSASVATAVGLASSSGDPGRRRRGGRDERGDRDRAEERRCLPEGRRSVADAAARACRGRRARSPLRGRPRSGRSSGRARSRRRPSRRDRSGSTRAPDAASRSSVAFAGWPYGLPAPADATATAGRIASMNACVVAVRLPWWATLSRSTCGRPLGQQRRIDAFLDVAHQQEPARPDLAEQDDRDVVDARPAVGRRRRHLTADRPEHAKVDLVDREAVAGGEAEPDRAPRVAASSRSHAA